MSFPLWSGVLAGFTFPFLVSSGDCLGHSPREGRKEGRRDAIIGYEYGHRTVISRQERREEFLQ